MDNKQNLSRLVLFSVFFAGLILPLFAGSEAVSKTKTEVPVEVAPAPKNLGPLLLDDFETGDYKKWYVFDKINPEIIPAPNPATNQAFGKYTLKVTGATESWYVGGIGMFIGKDASAANALQMYVYGTGPNSGKVKIEVADDDNGNFEKEQDDKFNLMYDDNWSYELTVNWTGWKRIVIPFKNFVDANPTVGNGVWDPNGNAGSGGLLSLQLIFLTPKQSGEINMGFDQIQLINLAQ